MYNIVDAYIGIDNDITDALAVYSYMISINSGAVYDCVAVFVGIAIFVT
jgi:hypothetical protein